MVLPDLHYPTIASLGPFTVTSWGFFVALGFLAGLYFIVRESKRRNLDIDEVYNFALITIIAGLAGARIGWFFTEGWGTTGFIEFLKIWNGGVIWSGGLIGALLAAYGYAHYNKINFLKYADVFAVGIPLGHALGRIGCLLSDYHLGKVTSLPWGIMFEGQPRHPIPIYEIIFLVPLFFVMWNLRTKKKFDGWLLGVYVIGYGVARFLLDFLRADPTYLGLTVAQYAALGLIAFFGWFLYSRSKKS